MEVPQLLKMIWRKQRTTIQGIRKEELTTWCMRVSGSESRKNKPPIQVHSGLETVQGKLKLEVKAVTTTNTARKKMHPLHKCYLVSVIIYTMPFPPSISTTSYSYNPPPILPSTAP
jgi:hypothetical protein